MLLTINQLFMKQLYIFSLVFLLCLTTVEAQIAFDWENATDNGTTITQTVNSITATFTTSTSDPDWRNGGGFAGSTGFAVASTSTQDTFVSITFSSPIDVENIFVFNGDNSNPDADWTFFPTGGTNSNVVANVQGLVGRTVTLDWTDVTQIFITSASGLEWFGVDEIRTPSLSTQEFDGLNTQIRLFPNPSTDYIQISNLKNTENYKIFNVLGSEVANGIVSDEEKIDIQNLTNGLYFLRFDNGNTMKFIKE